MSPLRFQIVSDLHLETPLMSPSYSHFNQRQNFPIHAPNLFLLGDIGLTSQPQLFTFLSTLLDQHANLRIFYVLGNHEPYHTTLELSLQSLFAFEAKVGTERFTFLHRRRVDLSDTLTILGCTLWTHIPPSSSHACATLLTDFDETNGIWERSVEQHNSDHALDLAFLNDAVAQITTSEPQRDIVILTHHSPTIDGRANHPRHDRSSTNDGFRTDLSGQVCWISPAVKMWGFGHTHFSCQFYDTVSDIDHSAAGNETRVKRKKLVLANQKGYAKKEVHVVVVVEAGEEDEGWRVVVGGKESGDLRVRRGEERLLANNFGNGDEIVESEVGTTDISGSTKDTTRKLEEASTASPSQDKKASILQSATAKIKNMFLMS